MNDMTITVGGMPIDEYLRKHPDIDDAKDIKLTDKDKQLIAIRREEIKRGWRKSIVRYNDRGRAEEKELNGRTKLLTDQEIRKGYGIMQKKFTKEQGGDVGNIIWAIFERGPLNFRGIYGILEWKKSEKMLSARIAQIWKALGDDGKKVIKREGRGNTLSPYRYSKVPGVDMTVERAIDLALIHRRNYAKSIKHNKAEEAAPIPAPAPENALKTTLKSLIEEHASRALGLDVKVSGQLDIVFSFRIGKEG